jgi:LysM domain
VVSIAEALDAERIPVSLAVTTEPPRITHELPPNVERFINIFQSNSVLGGVDVTPGPAFQGHFASFDIVEHTKITHVNMEKDGSIQDQVMAKILALATTPAKTEGDAVPIRFVVPADAVIELWDSGMPVLARPGDTLQTLAARYNAPLWSLAQINQVPDDVLLVPGQRVVIPRRLVPAALLTNVPLPIPRPVLHKR